MAVDPQGLLSIRRSCRIEQALLGNQHKRLFWRLASPHLRLGCSNLRQGPPHMYCASAQTGFRLPGDGTIKRKVNFEYARAIAKVLELATVSGWQTVDSHAQQLARRHITKDCARIGQGIERFDLEIGNDFATQ